MKPGVLRMFYGKADRHDNPQVCYQWGGSGADSCDAHLLNSVFASPRLEICYGDEREKHGPYKFGSTLIEEFEKRGYDISTLKFSIEQRKSPTQG